MLQQKQQSRKISQSNETKLKPRNKKKNGTLDHKDSVHECRAKAPKLKIE